MIVLETKSFKLGKFREFVNALGFLDDDDYATIIVDDTGGKLTVQLSVYNEHSCLSLYGKNYGVDAK